MQVAEQATAEVGEIPLREPAHRALLEEGPADLRGDEHGHDGRAAPR